MPDDSFLGDLDQDDRQHAIRMYPFVGPGTQEFLERQERVEAAAVEAAMARTDHLMIAEEK